ncbi:MAG: hypothetical protein IH934_04935 [Nanoarchaeota archaeon]|nr:hypothetical protein [Nanoarchaeota archaeon]
MSQPSYGEALEVITTLEVVQPEKLYTIKGVRLQNGENLIVQVTVGLLDKSNAHSQREWGEYGKQTGWGLVSGPLMTALFTNLYDNQDVDGVEEIRKIFAADSKDHGTMIMTNTRIKYTKDGSDVITHNWGMPDEFSLEGRLRGTNDFIGPGMEDLTLALLGNGDSSKVSDVYEWVLGGKPYLVRLASNPDEDKEYALVIDNTNNNPYFSSLPSYDTSELGNRKLNFNTLFPPAVRTKARGIRIVSTFP